VPDLIRTDVGLWSPDSPFATNMGVAQAERGEHDPANLRQALADAGYKGERIVVLAAADYPAITAVAEVGGDMLKKMGFNVDYQSLDWGTVVQRRAVKAPIDKGGWSIFFTLAGGTGNIIPAASTTIRANGDKAWFGWPTNPKQQALLDSWFDAPDLAAQQQVCRQIQEVFWQAPSWAPLGMFYLPAAFRRTITDIPEGFPLFYGVRRA
jgi:peptide/nickel transport system substrate-binding protein